jgi:hypothetical protein
MHASLHACLARLASTAVTVVLDLGFGTTPQQIKFSGSIHHVGGR